MPMTDALIVAAGTGERFGKGPKQFAPLHGRPVIAWAIEPFSRNDRIGGITVVVAPGHEERVRRLAAENGLNKIHAIVPGGDTRQDSVKRGLEALDANSESVLIHDAARPCLSGELLQRILEALRSTDAVVPSEPVVDTLIHERGGALNAILDRVGISRVQTPQGFRTSLIRRAHRNAEAKGIVSSDDASLVFALGEPVKTVAGERGNIKITFEDDLAIAEAIVAGRLRRAP
jgi:2-C-methyl-D-erythritol 4-phosphate cytidylyltransferase